MPGVYPGMFEQSILLAGRTSKRWTMVLSAAAELAGIGLLVMLPLIHAQRLPGFGLTSIAVWRPLAKPEPRVHPVRAAAQTKPIPFVRSATIFDPIAVPSHINLINDAPPELTTSDSLTSDGALMAVGPVAFSNNPLAPPRPVVHRSAVVTPPAATVRIKVSQMEPAKLLVKVVPAYPPMARNVRVSGTVYLLGVIATDGTIQSLHVISGHPLLVNAALDAVRQWRYKPTILNGRAVEVEAPISVTFTLQ